MPFAVTCPFCFHGVSVADRDAGHTILCTTCRQPLSAPPLMIAPEADEFIEIKPRRRNAKLTHVAFFVVFLLSGGSIIVATIVLGSQKVVVVAKAAPVQATPPVSVPAKAKPTKQDDLPIRKQPQSPKKTIVHTPTEKAAKEISFERIIEEARLVAVESRILIKNDFEKRQKLFNDDEIGKINSIMNSAKPLEGKEAVFLSQLNLIDMLKLRKLESSLNYKKAIAAAKIVWERSPKSRGISLLINFLSLYWTRDKLHLFVVHQEGFVDEDGEVIASVNYQNKLNYFKAAGRSLFPKDLEDVNPEWLQTELDFLDWAPVCMYILENRKVKSLNRLERDALIRFVGEEAVLNSP